MLFLLFIFTYCLLRDVVRGQEVFPEILTEFNYDELKSYPESSENITEQGHLVVGASPRYYTAWHIVWKIVIGIAVIFVLFANSTVIYIYHKLRRKVTMHEIHITNLAVVDLIGCVMATVPIMTGYLGALVSVEGDIVHMVCFFGTLLTHGCDVMATIICIVVSYDRLRLLQLGIRYHLVNNRFFSIARLVFLWALVTAITALIGVFIILSPLAKRTSDCAYSLSTKSWLIKIFMTFIALGPLTALVILNCMVRSEVKKLEERHPQVVHKSGPLEADNSTVGYTDRSSTNIAPSSHMMSGYSTPPERKVTDPLTGSKTLFRSFRSDRSLSRRATTSIAVSTLAFILCLSPLSALLIIEAWFPKTISTSTHTWHLWFTLLRTATDPFLFARNIPSFRLQYGTTIIKWQEKSLWFRCLHHVCCFPFICLDDGAVSDARERLDRKRRSSLAPSHADKTNEKLTQKEIGNAPGVSTVALAGSFHDKANDQRSDESTVKFTIGNKPTSFNDYGQSTDI